MSADPRLVALLERSGADALVSADPGVVRLLCGHAADLEVGPSPFALPAVVVAPGDGPAWLVASADEADEGPTTVTVAGMTTGPVARESAMRDGVLRALGGARVRSGALAVDLATVPAALLEVLDGARPPVDLPALGAVKRPDEVAGVAAAVALADAGQAAARAAAVAGASELEVWAATRAALEAAAGGRTVVLADLVSGPRCAEVGGPPGRRRLSRGELVLCDLAPRHAGLWGDSCATWAVGEPPPGAAALHDAALAALQAAKDALRPGTRAGEVDAAARGVLARAGFAFPHHTGHGVGFASHEEPRIVPGAERVLEPGMVVALEPGGYRDGLGLRVEEVVVVGDEAPTTLSRHDLSLLT